jgi:hypothetical protein
MRIFLFIIIIISCGCGNRSPYYCTGVIETKYCHAEVVDGGVSVSREPEYIRDGKIYDDKFCIEIWTELDKITIINNGTSGNKISSLFFSLHNQEDWIIGVRPTQISESRITYQLKNGFGSSGPSDSPKISRYDISSRLEYLDGGCVVSGIIYSDAHDCKIKINYRLPIKPFYSNQSLKGSGQ